MSIENRLDLDQGNLICLKMTIPLKEINTQPLRSSNNTIWNTKPIQQKKKVNKKSPSFLTRAFCLVAKGGIEPPSLRLWVSKSTTDILRFKFIFQFNSHLNAPSRDYSHLNASQEETHSTYTLSSWPIGVIDDMAYSQHQYFCNWKDKQITKLKIYYNLFKKKCNTYFTKNLAASVGF